MKQLILITSLLIFIFNIGTAQSVDIAIKILQGNTLIQGESVISGHINEIDAYDAGQTSGLCSQTQNCGIATGNFIFNMPISKAINPLKKVMYQGTRLSSVDVVFIKPGGGTPFEYYKIHMENVSVTNIAETGSNGAPNTFQISFDAQKFHWTYIPQLNNGSSGTPVKFGWDKVANVEFFY